MTIKFQIIYILDLSLYDRANRDWIPDSQYFPYLLLGQKQVHVFKITPFFTFWLKSKWQNHFSVWPVDGRFCSPFASTNPSVSGSSSVLPRTSGRMDRTEGRRQISNRGTPANAEKVFHYFQKGLSRFQSRHTWSLFHFFTILYHFSFFSLKLHRNREWNHMLVFSCVCASLFEQNKHGCCFHEPVFLFCSHSGATEGRWRGFFDTVAKQLYLSIWRSLSEERRRLRKCTRFPLHV